MDEKKRNIKVSCAIVGSVSLLIYIILTVVGKNNILFAFRILFAGIAAIVCAIKLGTEISNDDSCGNSVCFIIICLLNIMITAMQL